MKQLMSYVIAAMVVVMSLGCGSDAGAPLDPGDDFTPPEPLDWETTQRTPVSDLLHSVAGLGDVRIAVGEGGAILVRVGNGDWEVIEREFEASLRRVEMVEEKTALIIANDGVLRSEDAGRTWKRVLTSNTFLNDVSVSGKNAVAVGTNIIFVSTDGGGSWLPAPGRVPNKTYRFVSHLTDDIVVAAGIGGSLFKSTDGGITWVEFSQGSFIETPNDIAFFDNKNGVVALGNPTEVYWTNDAGDTWSQRASFGAGEIGNIDILDDETGYAILTTGQVHKTENAGKSWAFDTAVPPELSVIKSIDTSDPANWVAVGAHGFVSQSPNGGAAWQRVSKGLIGRFSSVDFIDTDVGIAVFSDFQTSQRSALRTTDGGLTWTAVDPQLLIPEAVEFSASGLGLLAGEKAVSKSTNGGASWQNIAPPQATVVLTAIAIIDDLTYVVCGPKGEVHRTDDGGSSWEEVTFEITSDTYRDVDFFPGTDDGVIVANQKSFRSSDRGVTWTQINLEAVAVACVTSDVAVAVGSEILRSTDRGATWSIVLVPGERLNGVSFSGLHGLVVGDDGLLLESLDGGLTWRVVPRETSVDLLSVAFGGEASATAGGADGAVLSGAP